MRSLVLSLEVPFFDKVLRSDSVHNVWEYRLLCKGPNGNFERYIHELDTNTVSHQKIQDGLVSFHKRQHARGLQSVYVGHNTWQFITLDRFVEDGASSY